MKKQHNRTSLLFTWWKRRSDMHTIATATFEHTKNRKGTAKWKNGQRKRWDDGMVHKITSYVRLRMERKLIKHPEEKWKTENVSIVYIIVRKCDRMSGTGKMAGVLTNLSGERIYDHSQQIFVHLVRRILFGLAAESTRYMVACRLLSRIWCCHRFSVIIPRSLI